MTSPLPYVDRENAETFQSNSHVPPVDVGYPQTVNFQRKSKIATPHMPTSFRVRVAMRQQLFYSRIAGRRQKKKRSGWHPNPFALCTSQAGFQIQDIVVIYATPLSCGNNNAGSIWNTEGVVPLYGGCTLLIRRRDKSDDSRLFLHT